MTDRPALLIDHKSAVDVGALKPELVAVHLDARAELVHQPFYSAHRFAERLDEHLHDTNFALVTGRIHALLVGYGYGATMPADTWFWTNLHGVADPELAHETGDRTFWLRELLARKAYQGHGYAHQIHDALLASRPEQRAALFVRSDNPAQHIYRRWGWAVVGHLPSHDDAPHLQAMLRDLTPPA